MKAAFLALPGCRIWQIDELLRQLVDGGWSIRTLTLGGQAVTTDGGLKLAPDGDVYRTFPRDFRLLLVAGGEVNDTMLSDPGLIRFLRQYDMAGGIIGSIGHGTVLLAAAGLLGGLHIALDENILDVYEQKFEHSILDQDAVVWDGSVITGRAQAAPNFAEGVLYLLQTYA